MKKEKAKKALEMLKALNLDFMFYDNRLISRKQCEEIINNKLTK